MADLNSMQALLSDEGEEGWEEIVDERISKDVNITELKAVATLAKQCVSPSSQNRPKMREVSQQLLRLGNKRQSRSIKMVSDHAEEAEMT